MRKPLNCNFTIIKGVFCISLDFEKFWGVRDVCDVNHVKERFKRIEFVVTQMLSLFEKHEIHATWATVGLLHCKSLSEMLEIEVIKEIKYDERNYSPFPLTVEKYGTVPFEILSATSEIELILKGLDQELASHTFSHFYTLEAGQTQSDFENDIDSMNVISKRIDRPFTSIVFPRNQINQEYLKILAANGYNAFRGNQLNKDWSNLNFSQETKLQKVRRVLDAYFKISKTKKFSIEELKVENGLVNIPASRFLRPNKGINFLEKRKLQRVKDEMTHAAVNGTVYHLWWHPHNFTFEPEKSLIQLEEILTHFQKLKSQFEFVSLNMTEIASYVKK